MLDDAFGPPQEENCDDKVRRRVQNIELIGSPRIDQKEVEALKSIEVSFSSSEAALMSY